MEVRRGGVLTGISRWCPGGLFWGVCRQSEGSFPCGRNGQGVCPAHALFLVPGRNEDVEALVWGFERRFVVVDNIRNSGSHPTAASEQLFGKRTALGRPLRLSRARVKRWIDEGPL